MDTFEERITARKAELITQRDQFMVSANQQLAAFGAAIAELDRLLTLKTDAPGDEHKPTQPGEPESSPAVAAHPNGQYRP